MGLFDLFKKKEVPTTVNIDDLFAPTFNGLSEKERLNLVDKCFYTLKSWGCLSNAYAFYLEQLANEINPNKRRKYFEFIKNIKVAFGQKTAETIKNYLDDGTLDYKNLPEWLNDKQFYEYESDTTSSNKIKLVVFLSNPKKMEKMGIASFDMGRLKNENGTWKTYGEIDEVVDELERQIDEDK